jgi:hypothetical protein
MRDEEFVAELQRLDAQGPEGLPEMRQLMKGQVSRLIALAAHGLKPAKKRGAQTPAAAPADRRTKIPDGFPDADAKKAACAFWAKKNRPDLMANVEDQAEQFHDHHLARNTKMLSWPAAWRTWMRNALEFNRAPHGMAGSAIVLFAQTSVEGWLKRLLIYYAGSPDQEPGGWHPTWGPKPNEQNCRAPQAAIDALQTALAKRITR